MEFISQEAISVLQNSTVGLDFITLPAEKLDRELYEEVNEVINRLGGKWKTGGKHKDGTPKGKHVFAFEVPEIFKGIIESRLLPPKNPTAFFPTPKPVIDKLFELLKGEYLPSELRILEPSAGTGAIALELKKGFPQAKLDVVEFLDINYRILSTKGFTGVNVDFMEYNPEYKYNLIVMNPPFSLEKDKNAYISHIKHAFDLLDKQGILISVIPTGYSYRQDKPSVEFKEFIYTYGEDMELPEGSFKESGTAVKTNAIFIKKEDKSWMLEEHSGYNSYFSFNFLLFVENDRPSCEAKDSLLKNISIDGFDKNKTPDKNTLSLINKFIDNAFEASEKEGIKITGRTGKGRDSIVKEIVSEFFDGLPPEENEITLKSSWAKILGSKAEDFTEEERKIRWKQWIDSALKVGKKEVVESWQSHECCEGCIHLDAKESWCNLQGLPNTVNPILTIKEGIIGMACMGVGKEEKQSQLKLFA